MTASHLTVMILVHSMDLASTAQVTDKRLESTAAATCSDTSSQSRSSHGTARKYEKEHGHRMPQEILPCTTSTSAGFVGFLSFVSDVVFNFLESQMLES